MIQNRSGYSARSPQLAQRRRARMIVIFSLLALVCIGIGLFFSLHMRGPFEKILQGSLVAKKQVVDAWAKGDRDAVLDMTRAAVDLRPLDSFFLTYRGFAAFYLGQGKAEGDEKTDLMNEAVLSLRKALVSGQRLPTKAQVEYVLAKAYYAKGDPWYDLAIAYMESSIKDGYDSADGNEYLGVLYAGLEKNDMATAHFEKALAKSRAELLLIAAAKTSIASGDADKAKNLLNEAVSLGKDATATLQAHLLLGEIAEAAADWQSAELQYQAVLTADPSSAEGWYRMGRVYQANNDPVRARAAWRKAASIDPTHAAARQRLSEKL